MNIQQLQCDVAVIGGGPAGIAAALAAARNGAKVFLAERNEYLGGNMSSGLPLLGFLDKNGNQVTGGIAQEIVDKLTLRGACLGHNPCPLHNSVTIIDSEMMKVLAFEMCKEAGIQVLLHCEVIDVNVENGRIDRVYLMGKGMRYDIEASVFIDATGDGDVAYLSGATYEKGQQETGILQPPSLLFTLSSFNEEKFWRFLEEHPEDLIPAESMNVSNGYDVQFFRSHPGYVFLGLRNTLTRMNEQNLSPFKRDTLIYIKTPHPGQICINATRILNFDGTDLKDLTRGGEEGMQQIVAITEFLKKYIPGFEDTYVSYINSSIGIRETRRFTGIKKLTIDNVTKGVIPKDSIALGSYKVDIHNGLNSSTDLIDLEGPYGIPLGCLISSEVNNLVLSGRCISMDAPSLASARVMTTCMAIGQAAGVCASLSTKNNILPSSVNSDEVRDILLKEKAILSIE